MRIHGTLTKWNEDRGFGFITPAKGPPDVFVHISAFPRDGVRPHLNELISFEVEPGKDGKKKAVRVMRPGQKATRQPAAAQERPPSRSLGAREVLIGLAIIGIGGYGYLQYQKRTLLAEAFDSPGAMSTPSTDTPPRFSCDGRTMCSQMTSCEEATFFIRNCPNTQMDGDNDGKPCESQWCN